MKVISLLFLSTASAFTVNHGFASVNVRSHVQTISARPRRNYAIANSLKLKSPRIHKLALKEGSNDNKVNGAVETSLATPTLVSALLLLALDVGFRRLFKKLAISFPSSLGGCGALFITLLTLPMGDKLFKILSPGAALLAKWLPVFFVPSLVTLPLVKNVGPASEVRRTLPVLP